MVCKEEFSILASCLDLTARSCTSGLLIYAIVNNNEHMVISEFVTNFHAVVSPYTGLCVFFHG
jgi:hypothetical protein